MTTKLLLHHKYKRIGLLLLIPSLILGAFCRFGELEFPWLNTPWRTGSGFLDGQINFTNELALTGVIASLLMIAFAREKQEDEYINAMRLESLQWAVLINYVLLIVATWLVHGFAYIDVMMYNMLTVLIIFIIRFNLVLRKNRIANPE
ncbi:MAG TPA: hypothetical protein VLA58_04525 [Chitinophagaceae bacterium]|nr:hypothetical protein [Chitinophagaceae bacterium]